MWRIQRSVQQQSSLGLLRLLSTSSARHRSHTVATTQQIISGLLLSAAAVDAERLASSSTTTTHKKKKAVATNSKQPSSSRAASPSPRSSSNKAKKEKTPAPAVPNKKHQQAMAKKQQQHKQVKEEEKKKEQQQEDLTCSRTAASESSKPSETPENKGPMVASWSASGSFTFEPASQVLEHQQQQQVGSSEASSSTTTAPSSSKKTQQGRTVTEGEENDDEEALPTTTASSSPSSHSQSSATPPGVGGVFRDTPNRVNWKEMQIQIQTMTVQLASCRPQQASDIMNSARTLIRNFETSYVFMDDPRVCIADHDDTLSPAIAIELVNAALRFAVPLSSTFILGLFRFLLDNAKNDLGFLKPESGVTYIVQIVNGCPSVQNLRVWDEKFFSKFSDKIAEAMKTHASLRDIISLVNAIGSKEIGVSRVKQADQFFASTSGGAHHHHDDHHAAAGDQHQADATSSSSSSSSSPSSSSQATPSSLVPVLLQACLDRADAFVQSVVAHQGVGASSSSSSATAADGDTQATNNNNESASTDSVPSAADAVDGSNSSSSSESIVVSDETNDNASSFSAGDEDGTTEQQQQQPTTSSTTRAKPSSSSSTTSARFEAIVEAVFSFSESAIATDPEVRARLQSWILQLIKATPPSSFHSLLLTATTLRLEGIFYPALCRAVELRKSMSAVSISKVLTSVMMLPRGSFFEVTLKNVDKNFGGCGGNGEVEQEAEEEDQQKQRSVIVYFEPSSKLSPLDIGLAARRHFSATTTKRSSTTSSPPPLSVSLFVESSPSSSGDGGGHKKSPTTKRRQLDPKLPLSEQNVSTGSTILIDRFGNGTVKLPSASSSSSAKKTTVSQQQQQQQQHDPILEELALSPAGAIDMLMLFVTDYLIAKQDAPKAILAAICSDLALFLSGAVALRLTHDSSVIRASDFFFNTISTASLHDPNQLLTAEMEYLSLCPFFRTKRETEELFVRIMTKVSARIRQIDPNLSSSESSESSSSSPSSSAPTKAQLKKYYLSCSQLRLLCCSTLAVKHDISTPLATLMLQNLVARINEATLSDISSVLYTVGRANVQVPDASHAVLGRKVSATLRIAKASKRFAAATAGSSRLGGGGGSSTGSNSNSNLSASSSSQQEISAQDLAVTLSGFHLTKFRWDSHASLFADLANAIASHRKRYSPAQCCQLVAIARDITRTAQHRGNNVLSVESTKLARIFLPQIRLSIPSATEMDLLPLLAWLATGHIRDVTLLNMIVERLIQIKAQPDVCISVLESVHSMRLLGGISSDTVFRMIVMAQKEHPSKMSADQNAHLAFHVTQLRNQDVDLIKQLVGGARTSTGVKPLCNAIGALSIIHAPEQEIRRFAVRLEDALRMHQQAEEDAERQEAEAMKRMLMTNPQGAFGRDGAIDTTGERSFSTGKQLPNLDAVSSDIKAMKSSSLHAAENVALKAMVSENRATTTTTTSDDTGGNSKSLSEETSVPAGVAPPAGASSASAADDSSSSYVRYVPLESYAHEIDLECIVASMTAVAADDSTSIKERTQYLNRLCIVLDKQLSSLPGLRNLQSITKTPSAAAAKAAGAKGVGGGGGDEPQNIQAAIAASSSRALPLGPLSALLLEVAAQNIPVFSVFRTCGKCFAAPGAVHHMTPRDSVRALSAYAAFGFRDDFVIRNLASRCYDLRTSIVKHPKLAKQCQDAMKAFHIPFDIQVAAPPSRTHRHVPYF